ncbi:hypothetical protein ACHAXR_007961 [Thalassiosira sp. AJA248-18]
MDRRSRVPAKPSMASVAALVTVLVVMLSGSSTTEAYAPALSRNGARKVSFSPVKRAGGGVHKRREDGSAVTLYLFHTPPSVAAANHRQQRSRSKGGGVAPRARSDGNNSRRSKTSLPAMSDSVIAPGDTLPSFHTAHGLLSPEVVMRIADANDLEQGGALHTFLKMYKRKGPMACLPMLSDPNVLPELTKAMREIA